MIIELTKKVDETVNQTKETNSKLDHLLLTGADGESKTWLKFSNGSDYLPYTSQ